MGHRKITLDERLQGLPYAPKDAALPPLTEATHVQRHRVRDRAARCREIAKEYHPSVGRPLYEKALELDREAARIERAGVERREGVFPR